MTSRKVSLSSVVSVFGGKDAKELGKKEKSLHGSFPHHCRSGTRDASFVPRSRYRISLTSLILTMLDIALPTAVTSVLDSSLEFIYSLEPLVAPTVCLGKIPKAAADESPRLCCFLACGIAAW